jgi:hypothetical protein
VRSIGLKPVIRKGTKWRPRQKRPRALGEGPVKLVWQFTTAGEEPLTAPECAAEIAEEMSQEFLIILFDRLEPRVLGPRIEPVQPRGEQTGPAQFAPILVPELSEIPRADAVDGRVAILEVGGYGQQVVDLWLELHLEVGRVIFRM